MDSEDAFGHALATRLRHEIADVTAAPDLGTSIARRHTRRTVASRALVATVVVVAIGVGALLVRPDLSAGPAPSPPVAVSPTRQTLTLEYVSTQLSLALADAHNYVLESRLVLDSPAGIYLGWRDMTTLQRRGLTLTPDGHLRLGNMEIHKPGDDGYTLLTVDYDAKTWHRTTYSPASSGPGPILGLIRDPTKIRDAVADGSMEILGQEQRNGVETVHLKLVRLPGFEGLNIDYWVDADTYLPVRLETPGSSRAVAEYTWLPRTPENVALTTLSVPDGFKHVADDKVD